MIEVSEEISSVEKILSHLEDECKKLRRYLNEKKMSQRKRQKFFVEEVVSVRRVCGDGEVVEFTGSEKHTMCGFVYLSEGETLKIKTLQGEQVLSLGDDEPVLVPPWDEPIF